MSNIVLRACHSRGEGQFALAARAPKRDCLSPEAARREPPVGRCALSAALIECCGDAAHGALNRRVGGGAGCCWLGSIGLWPRSTSGKALPPRQIFEKMQSVGGSAGEQAKQALVLCFVIGTGEEQPVGANRQGQAAVMRIRGDPGPSHGQFPGRGLKPVESDQRSLAGTALPNGSYGSPVSRSTPCRPTSHQEPF